MKNSTRNKARKLLSAGAIVLALSPLGQLTSCGNRTASDTQATEVAETVSVDDYADVLNNLFAEDVAEFVEDDQDVSKAGVSSVIVSGGELSVCGSATLISENEDDKNDTSVLANMVYDIDEKMEEKIKAVVNEGTTEDAKEALSALLKLLKSKNALNEDASFILEVDEEAIKNIFNNVKSAYDREHVKKITSISPLFVTKPEIVTDKDGKDSYTSFQAIGIAKVGNSAFLTVSNVVGGKEAQNPADAYADFGKNYTGTPKSPWKVGTTLCEVEGGKTVGSDKIAFAVIGAQAEDQQ